MAAVEYLQRINLCWNRMSIISVFATCVHVTIQGAKSPTSQPVVASGVRFLLSTGWKYVQVQPMVEFCAYGWIFATNKPKLELCPIYPDIHSICACCDLWHRIANTTTHGCIWRKILIINRLKVCSGSIYGWAHGPWWRTTSIIENAFYDHKR